MSLAYYCSARYIDSKGLVIVQSGIDTEKEKEVSNAIVNQLNDIRNGKFDDELLEAKPYLKIAQYEGANTALVRAVTPGFNEYATAVNALWENVRNGADVESAAQDCVDELTTAFMEYE